MKKYTVTTSTNLINFCSAAGIFTDATSKQTEKLLYANENGFPIEEIAAMIWMCSDSYDPCRLDILSMLKIERLYFYKKLFPGVDSINSPYYFTNINGLTVKTSFKDFVECRLGKPGYFIDGYDAVDIIANENGVVWERYDD